MPRSILACAAALLLTAVAAPARAAEAAFKAAYASAEAANAEAGKLRNQWTTAVAALAAAKKAAEAGDFDKATSEARKSEQLSRAAIFQADEQKTNWKLMEIR
ncbi:MAG: hypothetical protein M9932_16410 [Xanthobacteraceae bacterium]|nr:hypothetical protein [Xanthobacteraceae bacterium]